VKKTTQKLHPSLLVKRNKDLPPSEILKITTMARDCKNLAPWDRQIQISRKKIINKLEKILGIEIGKNIIKEKVLIKLIHFTKMV
jgi:hypothetical protein